METNKQFTEEELLAKKAEMLEYVQIIDDEFDRTYPNEGI